GPVSCLDRALDPSGPPVRDVRAGEDEPPFRLAKCRPVAHHPARSMSHPRPARELVVEPIVRIGLDNACARDELLDGRSHRRAVMDIELLRPYPEAHG